MEIEVLLWSGDDHYLKEKKIFQVLSKYNEILITIFYSTHARLEDFKDFHDIHLYRIGLYYKIPQ